MTGKRAFDEEQVLKSALNLFRLHGFAGTGLAELEKATGLNRSSLYNAYGSKEGLFLKSLEFFHDVFAEMSLAELEKPTLKQSLTDFFEASGGFLSPRFPGGCPATLASLELGGIESKIAAELERGILKMVDRVHQRCKRAVEAGELPENSDCKAIAAMVIANTRGVVVLSMATRQPELGRAANAALVEAICQSSA